jgi:hypothetical protein
VSSDVQDGRTAGAVRANGRQIWLWVLRAACGVCALGSWGLFLQTYDYSRAQWMDGLWFVAIMLWVALVGSFEPEPLLEMRVTRAELGPLAVILAIFAAAWLPFYDNWRWAFMGDSFSVFGQGYWFGRNGLRQSLLSVHGYGDSFTYLWEISYHFPMRLFAPTLFWHRVGQLLWACLALTAIYAYFTLVLNRAWGAAIAVATALNYVWLWFTYVAYLKIDSSVFYFLTLIFATLIWRQPDRLGPWLFCGLTAGLSFFYTPTAWSAVILVGLGLAVFAVATRRFVPALVYGISLILVATTILVEWRWLLSMTAMQTAPLLEWEYLRKIFQEIILMPYVFYYEKLGVQGAFLRWPLGPLYLVGLGIAALALVPPVRRLLGVPTLAPALLVLLLWDAVLLTLTNKGYAQPSTKRAYNLIPLQVFFALVPLIVLSTWSRSRRRLHGGLVGLTVAAIAVYGVANLRLIMFPAPRVYGGNVFDGIIELRQRFPQQRVVLMTQRNELRESFSPDELMNAAYHVADNLTLSPTFTDATIEAACQQDALVCYEPNYDAVRMEPLLQSHQTLLRRFPLLNSFEMVCYECIH